MPLEISIDRNKYLKKICIDKHWKMLADIAIGNDGYDHTVRQVNAVPCAQFSSNAFSSEAFSSSPFRPILLG